MAKLGVFEQYRKGNLIDYVLRKDSVSVLEGILEIEHGNLSVLHCLLNSSQLEFGGAVSREELPGLLDEVRPDVEAFLGEHTSRSCGIKFKDASEYQKMVSDALKKYMLPLTVSGACIVAASWIFDPSLSSSLGWGCSAAVTGLIAGNLLQFPRFVRTVKQVCSIPTYEYAKNTIGLIQEPSKCLVATIAHEYAHHVQNCIVPLNKGLIAFNEGISRGVERYVADKYSGDGDFAYLYGATENTVLDLARCYDFVCRNTGRKPLFLLDRKLRKRKIDDHALGTSFFYIKEALNGRQVYADALHGKAI